ncbi:8-amino-7-oxononanoate synthase [Catenulispora sp. GAS73]|uniref:aminotransferase class I/II-fold pyridoxal phosphate-dependent enzyme n=1 Tax=Catenulispora sp. GAS73 TaxID=3156269 RepID=UPI003517B15F
MLSLDRAPNRDDIAIVGMSCRFPGAENVNEYWNLLKDPEPQFAPIPRARWVHDSFFSDDRRDTHTAYVDRLASVADAGMFDAKHYKIPPRRARALDPQHRLLVDLAREAIQDAGWEASGFDRENTSVIVGLGESGYRELSTINLRLRQIARGEFGTASSDPGWTAAGAAVEGLHGTALSGLLMNMGPSSISSTLGLHGESYAIESACSGGLAAIANAVFALRTGRCKIALAGAAQLILVPDLLIGLCRIGALSPSGTCRPFDTRADGFVLGEGAGILVLRPLADAKAAGDRIYAVIRGVGLSNDGLVEGGMTPQAEGQMLALRRAYQDAAVSMESVGYLEAHGTGTSVGDRVEISALRELRQDTSRVAHFGAVKSVVGHALGAAGIAGLIKSVLSVHKKQIVPQPDVRPDENLGLEAAGLTVPEKLTEWVEPEGPLRAGVSAFGFGGTNVHVVIEQDMSAADPQPDPQLAPRPEVLVFSARDRAGLATYAAGVAKAVAEDCLPLSAVAETLARRSPLGEQMAVVAIDAQDASRKLTLAAALVGTEATSRPEQGVFFGSVPTDLDVPRGDADVAPQLCTLPPSPLAPKHYWIVDESKQSIDEIEPFPTATLPSVPEAGRESASAVPSGAGPDARPEAAPAGVDIPGLVLEEVARISAFSVSDLQDHMGLVEDLGFDSLMIRELDVSIKKRVPGLRKMLDELVGKVTIAEIAALIEADPAVVGMSSTLIRPVAEEPAPRITWEPDSAGIEGFAELNQFEARVREIRSLGLPNPYFRIHEGNIRNTTTIDHKQYISFSSYNYLGLSGHPVVTEAVRSAVERYGSSVSASRVLAGERPLTRQLEQELSRLLGTEDCVTLVSGHATNVTAIGHVVGPQDLIVHDALAHDSILQGCRLSGATRRPFAHNDVEQLDDILRRTRSHFRRVLMAVEGAYSMDGDIADLPGLIALKKRYGALLFVDEAHSVGVLGRRGGGVGDFFDVDRSDVDLWMGTLSKSLASCGGYLAGSARTVNWLKYTLPGFVYSAGLTPANAAAALAAVQLIRSEPERLTALHENADLFRRLAEEGNVNIGSSRATPVVPCIIGDSAKTLRLASRLFERGIVVDPILHPAVEEKLSRLRFFMTSEHHSEEVRYAVDVLTEELSGLGG